ncbi:MAG: glycosyl hydrolase [Pseudomonadales bacterium]
MTYSAARRITIAGAVILLSACGGGGGASSALPAEQSPDTTQTTPPPQDTQPPVITLLGEATLVIEQGTTFVDPGATASDAVDGAVTVSVTGTVGDTPGSYTLTYSATDRAGNQASITRTVVVQAMATEPTARDLVVFNDGLVGPSWDEGINAFDEAIGFSECNRDGGAGCPSIAWRVTDDEERGPVLEIEHAPSGRFAGVFLSTSGIIDLSDFSAGSLVFDVRIMSGDSAITMKLDCNFPCTSGDRALGSRGASGWERVEVPLTSLVAGGLNLRRVNTGIVIWATETTSTRFRIDNVHFAGLAPGASLPTATLADDPAVDFTLLPFGAGTVADKPNPASRRCVFDFGNFIFNAGVVRPEIGGCDVATSTPLGEPTPRAPQLTGPAAAQPTMTHRWWGSLPFLGEMQVGAPSDAAFITPDPINARITERGVRLGSIPAGLKVNGDGFLYPIPDPFAEVFDGIAIANSDFDNLEARLKDFSEGSVTVEWQSGTTAVMTATFVHGSPYVFFDVHAGDLLVRTLRADGGEKGTFYRQGNSLGVTTNVAGQRNNFLLTGEGATSFEAITSDEITVKNARGAVTVTYLPEHNAVASEALARFFETRARNVIASVSIAYALDPLTQAVTVTHRYLDSAGALVNTLAGLQPLHWKHSALPLTNFSVRSARGVTRFAETASFSYTLPWVGVLPSLPPLEAALDPELFASLLRAFIDQGPNAWNTARDTYFTGKNYGKVAELIALAHNARLEEEATILRDWLKAELEDWFTASTNDVFDEQKYFAFDSQWNTLLGFDEAFASHQQLNDHHFHYGYFVRAAAEICRVDADWCGADQWGPMVELLIRDYAGGREDPLFPYLRHFDPANGFSWASGQVNFVRGNNNESTSEAANAYGAMVLYGLATGNSDLTERGIYLHASQTAAAREYWTNIDGHEAPGTDRDNFPPGYGPLMTSIVWGDGGAFATFFSGARAHILGIQTLPINGLMLHLGVDPDYLRDYVALGLSESTNGLPSGLVNDQWPDIWWNVLALTDPDRALADYETLPNYLPEGGETKAHTYHWLKTLAALGHIQTGTGALTVDYPTAVAFERSGVTTYVAYNFDDQDRTVRFSDGQTIIAAPGRFTIVTD